MEMKGLVLIDHYLCLLQGQKDLKECHWHPQIQGMLMTTAGDGFNILRPANLDNLPALEPDAMAS